MKIRDYVIKVMALLAVSNGNNTNLPSNSNGCNSLNLNIITFADFKKGVAFKEKNGLYVSKRDKQISMIKSAFIDTAAKQIQVCMENNCKWRYKIIIIDFNNINPTIRRFKSLNTTIKALTRKQNRKRFKVIGKTPKGFYRLAAFAGIQNYISLETFVLICEGIQSDQMIPSYDGLCCNITTGLGNANTRQYMGGKIMDYLNLDYLEWTDIDSNRVHGGHIRPLYDLFGYAFGISAYDHRFNIVYNRNIKAAMAGDQTAKDNIYQYLIDPKHNIPIV
jgi:hypothetical protein